MEEQKIDGSERRWANVESGRTVYGQRMDVPLAGEMEKTLYTDNQNRRLPGAVLKELLEERANPAVYVANYLWMYFGLENEFEETAKEELLKVLQEKGKLERKGKSDAEQLFSRMVKDLQKALNHCGAVYEKKSKKTETAESASARWTEVRAGKLLRDMQEEEFIQIFAPALGLSLYEINDFLLKAYHREELNPYEKEEFLLYLAVLQADSESEEQSYYPVYRKLCQLYGECGADSALTADTDLDMRQIWKEAEDTMAQLKEENPDWAYQAEAPAGLEKLLRKHKTGSCSERDRNQLRKKTLERLWKEVCQLYRSELSYAECDARDSKKYKKNDQIDRNDDDIWKNVSLEVKIHKKEATGIHKEAVELKLPKNLAETTLEPVCLNQIRDWKEEKVWKEEKEIHRLNLNCKYGAWIPAGTVLDLMHRDETEVVFEITEEYLGIGSEELRRFLYESTELLDEDEAPETKKEYEKDLDIFEGWFESTKLYRTVFQNFEKRKQMAQRNYILTLLFLKFVKTEKIEDLEKETRRRRFVSIADEELKKLQLPEIYLAFPYDALLYYLLANREPDTELRLLWARFEQKKKEIEKS